jgi:hypothetical protein
MVQQAAASSSAAAVEANPASSVTEMLAMVQKTVQQAVQQAVQASMPVPSIMAAVRAGQPPACLRPPHAVLVPKWPIHGRPMAALHPVSKATPEYYHYAMGPCRSVQDVVRQWLDGHADKVSVVEADQRWGTSWRYHGATRQDDTYRRRKAVMLWLEKYAQKQTAAQGQAAVTRAMLDQAAQVLDRHIAANEKLTLHKVECMLAKASKSGAVVFPELGV